MSAISLRCPGCKRRLAAPREASGQTLSCPNCRAAVTVAVDGNTIIDGDVPDFSYLRNLPEPDDDILTSEDPDDAESALGQSTARQPSKPTTVVPASTPAVPPPIIYTPPPVGTKPPSVAGNAPPADNPFTQLSDTGPKSRRKVAEHDSVTNKSVPPSKTSERLKTSPEPAPVPAVRTPKWVWPVLIALAVYAAFATGVGAWGWLRPASTDPPTAKPAR